VKPSWSAPIAFVLLVLSARPGLAHAVGVSRGEYHASGAILETILVFARPELIAAVGGLDGDGDGFVPDAEWARRNGPLAKALLAGLEVGSADGPCPGALAGVSATEADGVAIHLSHRCGRASSTFTVRLALLHGLSAGHRHIATVVTRDGATETRVLFESSPELRISSAASDTSAGVAWPLFRLGLQHILTGYDHLLFLFGLVLVGGRLRSFLVVITAFTVAHSITLGIAALGGWAPSPRLVEPAIALSIVYIGIENCFVRDAGRRWLITFPFGLIHGFGFAGALREVALPQGQIPLALASFNVGVEAGQIAVLALILPGLVWLGRRPWFVPSGLRALSLGVTLAGVCWFVQRVV